MRWEIFFQIALYLNRVDSVPSKRKEKRNWSDMVVMPTMMKTKILYSFSGCYLKVAPYVTFSNKTAAPHPPPHFHVSVVFTVKAQWLQEMSSLPYPRYKVSLPKNLEHTMQLLNFSNSVYDKVHMIKEQLYVQQDSEISWDEISTWFWRSAQTFSRTANNIVLQTRKKQLLENIQME